MTFKEWLKIDETGTMAAAVSGGGGTGTGDIAQFKQRIGFGHGPAIRRGHRKKKDGSIKSDIDTIIDKT
jgi:hypothetical protein